MAARKIKKTKTTDHEEKHFCGECEKATPDLKHENLSLLGQPTLVSCPLYKYKQNFHQLACTNFTPQKAI